VTFEEDTMKLKMQGRELVFKIVPDDDSE